MVNCWKTDYLEPWFVSYFNQLLDNRIDFDEWASDIVGPTSRKAGNSGKPTLRYNNGGPISFHWNWVKNGLRIEIDCLKSTNLSTIPDDCPQDKKTSLGKSQAIFLCMQVVHVPRGRSEFLIHVRSIYSLVRGLYMVCMHLLK